jgi:glutathione synthase/RimK-type ligase-like ATP-grasp enzyme
VDEVGLDRVIYKTFLATEEHWRETRIFGADEIDALPAVALAPVIFQEFVPAVADVRLTVVGDRQFATAISAPPGGYTADYRIDLDGAEFKPTELEPGTAAKVGALMKRLGLLYGAIDLRRTPTGEDVFLEINPAGEWLFAEERSGQPITDAMAELLVELDRGDR